MREREREKRTASKGGSLGQRRVASLSFSATLLPILSLVHPLSFPVELSLSPVPISFSFTAGKNTWPCLAAHTPTRADVIARALHRLRYVALRRRLRFKLHDDPRRILVIARSNFSLGKLNGGMIHECRSSVYRHAIVWNRR